MENTLTVFLAGGRSRLKRKNELSQQLLQHPELLALIRNFPHNYKDISKCFHDTIFLTRRINTLIEIDGQDDYVFMKELTGLMYGCSVHGVMFLPSLEHLSSPEQAAAWLPDAKSFKNIGTFIQTELGHGSNVQSIETTATFDFQTKDFVLNSPTSGATKWWPGLLGYMANVGILQAQLYIRGKCYGVHSFYIRFRKEDSHDLVDGIESGSLPDRIFNNFSDNGFLRFNNVHIPRQSLLGKIAKVDESGQYTRMGDPHKAYLPMMKARLTITYESTVALKRCLQVALKYNSVRRQGHYSSKKSREIILLDHQTQQLRLLPTLGLLFGLTALALDAQTLCAKVDDPGEVHLVTCIGKAHVAQLSSAGCEAARRSLGGNGFLVLSRCAPISLLSLTTNTVEGDNVLLYLQIARYMLGVSAGRRASEIAGFLTEDIPTIVKRDLKSPLFLRDITQLLCMKLLNRLKEKMAVQMAKKNNLDVVMATNAQEMVECAKIFSDLFIMDSFIRQRLSQNCVDQVLDHVQLICFLHLVLIRLDHHLEMETIASKECPILRSQLLKSCQIVRSNVGMIIEALSLPKEIFDSALLGDSNEEIHENLLKEARDGSNTFRFNPNQIDSKL